MNEGTRRQVEAVGGWNGRRWAARRLLWDWVRSLVPPTEAPPLDFDALAQDLAQGVSRRQILRRLVGAAAAGHAAPVEGFAPPA
jgi:hypothetical protein